MGQPLLSVKNLSVGFHSDDGTFMAVRNLSFEIDKGESVCIVGESGCGKSVTSLAIMRLLDTPPAEVTGSVVFEGEDLLQLPMDKMRSIRGNKIAMIFQEPMTSLNPVFTCGFQISEALILHQGLTKAEARERSIELMRMVGIPEPEKRFGSYPHELSGGMRQRVMIAMALACRPSLLIADEPTTALDVTIQAQIMQELHDLTKRMDMALILITHDMGVVAQMAEKVIVMYAGEAVEETDVRTLFKKPLHPYTEGLLGSIPRLDSDSSKELNVIEGTVPGMYDMPKGCKFAPRCKKRMERCDAEDPLLCDVEPGHAARCFLYSNASAQEKTSEEASDAE